ncbi:MAG: YdeI/OmpD-associated family protein [Pyrinomonadaceae bacterium]
MGKRDERVDAYIAKSADFAKPILEHLREIVHRASPEIEESWKWSFPNFDYKGIVCSMAAFKQHCSFGFWKASLMSDPEKLLTNSREAMGQMGQIRSLADLPPDDVLIAYIKEAVELNEKGVKLPSKAKTAEKKPLEIPDYFVSALEGNEKASGTFENFSYSNKKDYVEWITEAKTEETRNKRLATAVEQMAEGKTRHWKYAKK